MLLISCSSSGEVKAAGCVETGFLGDDELHNGCNLLHCSTPGREDYNSYKLATHALVSIATHDSCKKIMLVCSLAWPIHTAS